jgi:hypothetical protein
MRWFGVGLEVVLAIALLVLWSGFLIVIFGERDHGRHRYEQIAPRYGDRSRCAQSLPDA